MICKTCAQAADLEDMALHDLCKGLSWCDCEHKPIINIPIIGVISDGRTEENRTTLRSED